MQIKRKGRYRCRKSPAAEVDQTDEFSTQPISFELESHPTKSKSVSNTCTCKLNGTLFNIPIQNFSFLVSVNYVHAQVHLYYCLKNAFSCLFSGLLNHLSTTLCYPGEFMAREMTALTLATGLRMSLNLCYRDMKHETSTMQMKQVCSLNHHQIEPCLDGEKPTGSKLTCSKDHLSLMLCVNMTGTDKQKPVLVGKAANPACLKKKGLSIANFGYHNAKGWMTGAVFDLWLSEWNRELYKQKRKIALLIDNAPGHITDDYDNIKLVFLPPNTTSKLQPLDQGITSWVKREYRRLITVEYVAGCDQKEDVKTIMKAFDFAVACENTVKAWNRCSAQTIANCFIRAGFITGPLPEPEPPKNVSENIQRVLETNMTFDEYASHDNDVKTCEPLTDEAIIEAGHWST